MDLAGRTVGSVSLGRSPSPLQDEDVEGYLQRMARLELGPSVDEAALDLGRMARSVRDRFAENRPLVVDLHCEGNLTAWVQTFDTSLDPLGRGPIWQRISADGTSQMVRFPGPFSPFVFTQNGVFGVSENSEGSQTLAWSPAQPGALSPVSHQLSLQER